MATGRLRGAKATDVILVMVREGFAHRDICRFLSVDRRTVEKAAGIAGAPRPPMIGDPPIAISQRRRIAELENTITALRNRYEAMLGGDTDKEKLSRIRALGFSPKEAQIIDVLFRRAGRVTQTSRLYEVLYGDRYDGGPEPKIVTVYMYKIRRSLSARGVDVQTHRGVGYSMTEVAAERLRQMLSQASA